MLIQREAFEELGTSLERPLDSQEPDTKRSATPCPVVPGGRADANNQEGIAGISYISVWKCSRGAV